MSGRVQRRDFLLGAALGAVGLESTAAEHDAVVPKVEEGSRRSSSSSHVSDGGEVEVPCFTLPASTFLSERSRGLFVEQARLWQRVLAEQSRLAQEGATMALLRRRYSELLATDLIKQRNRFKVRVTRAVIDGVGVQIFEPAERMAQERRTLLNLHGGGFTVGDDVSAQIESIPIAATAGMRVISVDYRMAPEHVYPAATNDVVTVYRALLNESSPRAIGIFGSSAGALLAAQVVSRSVGIDLPRPGALALLALGASRSAGDSLNIFGTIERLAAVRGPNPYFASADPRDPDLWPAESPERLRAFPPSLLVSSTRDLGLSSVVDTHRKLVALNVRADLHVWEGLRHCFYYDPDFQESAEVYAVTASFFRSNLQ